MAPRKKVEIRPIKSEEERHVCFSKRRTGLFNKATELAIKCGVEVAAITFSPGGKAFTYGHPSVESVLHRFIPSNSPEAQTAAAVAGGAGDGHLALEEINRENGELRARLEAVKARKKAAKEDWAKARAEGFQAAVWLDALVGQMGKEDLVAFAAALKKVRALVAARADPVVQEAGLTGGGVETMQLVQEAGLTGGGVETMQQQQEDEEILMEMPLPPGFDAGMEMMPQGFGPHGFPQ